MYCIQFDEIQEKRLDQIIDTIIWSIWTVIPDEWLAPAGRISNLSSNKLRFAFITQDKVFPAE